MRMSSIPNDLPDPFAHPRELAGDPARQAVASIRGIVYQIWWSIDAWLRLRSPDEVIFLEGAEDLDRITSSGAITGQVKHEVESLSLNNKRSHEALENFWDLSLRESTRRVDFHYITTASAARERDAQFEGLAGFEAWRIAQTDAEMAARIQRHAAIFWDARLLAVTIKPNKAKTCGRQQAEAVSDAPRARACRFVLRVSNLRLSCCIRRPIDSQSS